MLHFAMNSTEIKKIPIRKIQKPVETVPHDDINSVNSRESSYVQSLNDEISSCENKASNKPKTVNVATRAAMDLEDHQHMVTPTKRDIELTSNHSSFKNATQEKDKDSDMENEDEDIELVVDANRIPILNKAIKKVLWPNVKFFNGDYEIQEYKKGSLGDLLCRHIGVPEPDRYRYWNLYWNMVPKLLGRHRSDCSNYMKQAFMGKVIHHKFKTLILTSFHSIIREYR